MRSSSNPLRSFQGTFMSFQGGMCVYSVTCLHKDMTPALPQNQIINEHMKTHTHFRNLTFFHSGKVEMISLCFRANKRVKSSTPRLGKDQGLLQGPLT